MRILTSLAVGICLLMLQTNGWAELRIIGGKAADDWPWMVAIIETDRNSVKEGFSCGATLIHPSWVLTAAHCTVDELEPPQDLPADSLEVVLGRYTVSDGSPKQVALLEAELQFGLLTLEHDLNNEKAGEIFKIQQIIQHPDYDKHPLNPLADLALLELERPSTQPVLKIAETYSFLTQTDELATVIGWGQTDAKRKNSSSDILRQTDVPIISNEICNQAYEGEIQDTMLCAGYKEGNTDACGGDSGGPLIIESYAGPQQIGIVSWGEGCAEPNYYGVYTRVSSYQKFVTEHICEAEDIPPTPQVEVQIAENQATLSWKTSKGADGYQLYWAPYSDPLNATTLEHINSIDLGNDLSLRLNLANLKRITDKLYVALRAYNGNCYSAYSNLGTLF